MKSQATNALLENTARKNSFKGLNTGQLSTVLKRYIPQIAQALPNSDVLSPDRMVQMYTTLIAKNPAIADCEPDSVIGALLQASILGFKPVEALGHCYFVPYKGRLQFQIGYKGYIELARRSDQVKSIHAFCVFKGDTFNYSLGLNPSIYHTPTDDPIDISDWRLITHVYAVAHYKSGGYNFIVLTKNQIERLRKASPNQNGVPDGIWHQWYDKMAMAKAIKQLAPYMPLSDQDKMQHAIMVDEKILTPTSLDKGEFTGDAASVDIDPEPFSKLQNNSSDVSTDNDREQTAGDSD